MLARYPTPRVSYIGTGGILSDLARAAELRDENYPPTEFPGPTTAVLDLAGITPTVAALRELVVPLGQRLRGGVLGEVRLVIATPDRAVAEIVSLLAREHELPLFLATSSSPADVARGEPAGDLTRTELDTLEELGSLGGGTTVASLAEAFNIEPTAAHNRLVNLTRKGYVYRLHRGRRRGDLFMDPRSTMTWDWLDLEEPAPMRAALTDAGIDSDPYDRSPVRLEGDAADRAVEILRRRGKAS